MPKQEKNAKLSPVELPSIAELRTAEKAAKESSLFRFAESDGEKVVSDKVYGIFVLKSAMGPGLFDVHALYGGRKASSLSRAVKASGVPLEEARAVVAKEGAARLKKLYAPAASVDELAGEELTQGAGDFAYTASDAKKMPAEFNDGFGRPDLARIWGKLSPYGENLFVSCGADLIFSDIVVGPKRAIDELARKAKPLIDAVMEAQMAEADDGEKPVAAFAIWDGGEGQHSVAGTFVLGQDSFLGDIMADLGAQFAKSGVFVIATSSSDNDPAGAFAEIPARKASTQDAREALIRSMSKRGAATLLSGSGQWPSDMVETAQGMAARAEAQALGSVAEPGSKKRSRLGL